MITGLVDRMEQEAAQREERQTAVRTPLRAKGLTDEPAPGQPGRQHNGSGKSATSPTGLLNMGARPIFGHRPADRGEVFR
jgi:hypothetical protein